MKQKIFAVFKRVARTVNAFLGIFERKGILALIILLLCYTVSATLRALPARWGIYLTEFDPFYEYYVAKKIVEKGFFWWFSWFLEPPQLREYDKLFWYPWGRDIRATSPPGISFVSAFTYLFLRALGWNVDLYTVHAFVPVFWAPLAIIAVFLLAKELKNEFTGLIAAFLMSMSSAYLSRTMMGGKHESVAIPLMLFSFYFYLRSLRSLELKGKVFYSVISAACLGFVALAWGGYLYPWNLIGLSILALIALGKATHSDLVSFATLMALSSIFIAMIPRYGVRVVFTSFAGLVPLTALIASIVMYLGIKRIRGILSSPRTRIILVVALLVVGLVLWRFGIIASVSSRILSVIFPQRRSPLIESVAEHRFPTWAMIYEDYRVWLLFSILGLYLMLKKFSAQGIFSALFYITALYAASSFARLTLLLCPALSIAAGYAFAEIVEGLVEGIRKGGVTWRRRELEAKIKEYSAVCMLVILFIASFGVYCLSSALAQAHTPSLIVTSSIPFGESFYIHYSPEEVYRYSDWLSALEWMKENLPKNAVVVSWWDYGYWIAINTNRSSICDNATLNATQIKLVAKAFLSSEEEAIKIFKKLGVTHVVVFDPFQGATLGQLGISLHYPQPQGLGDFGKSYWMARIAGLDPKKYITYGKIVYRQTFHIIVPANTPEARNATLYHLLFIKTRQRMHYIFERPPIPWFGERWPIYEGPVVSIPQPKHFRLVYISKPNGWVLVFEILYPEKG